jgi:hypothetical protein
MWYVWEKQICMAFMGKLEEKSPLGGRRAKMILLKRSLKEQDGMTGFICLSVGKDNRLL